MIEAGLFQAVVSNYLSAAGREWSVERHPRAFDFLVVQAEGRAVALDVRTAAPGDRTLAQLKAILTAPPMPIEAFVLVTPFAPSAEDMKRFDEALADVEVPHVWAAINELPGRLGASSADDLLAPETIGQMQRAVLVKNLEKYAAAPAGPEPQPLGRRRGPAALPADLPAPYASLVRQLPFAVVQGLRDQPGELEAKLRFGEKISHVTVLLSDLKNFSSLVTASSPEVLNDSMAKYYRRVRDAVFTHGGMLDKFIGDAVLAVFGYPVPSPGAAVNAVRFARDLIGIGHDVLRPWLGEVNAVIETGTRVGMSTGELWPLNIGQRELELTLLGDTINLAARLEKNCLVDGILFDNRTATRLQASNPDFWQGLRSVEAQVAPSDAKGQAFAVRAWQVPPIPRPN